MNQRRPRSDDVLFISAFATILLGLAFLLYTTKTFVGLLRVWPILVMAAGGVLLYFALVRGASVSFFFGGLFFVLEGAFFLTALLLDWQLVRAWPLSMTIAGLAGLLSGLAARKRLRTFFLVPSIGFIALGLVFADFSFGLAKIGFKSFIAMWWPSLLIAGGILLFVAYGLSRRSPVRRAEGAEGRPKKGAGKSANRSGRDRDPPSGP